MYDLDHEVHSECGGNAGETVLKMQIKKKNMRYFFLYPDCNFFAFFFFFLRVLHSYKIACKKSLKDKLKANSLCNNILPVQYIWIGLQRCNDE